MFLKSQYTVYQCIYSIFIVIFTIYEISFLLQQKYSHIACFWEKQPSGCVRISCAFHHTKPRNINGLFLPPSNNVSLQQGGQERILHPAHHQKSLRNQENILLPVHAPLIISLKKEEDEEDDDEKENYVSDWVPKTAAEIEEERAIKEICYKTGEYYRMQYPHEHQSAQTVSSPREKEKLLLEATERDLQKGDGSRIPRTFINTKREGEISGRRIPTERIPTRDRRSFDNGDNHSELVNKHHSKEIKKNKWTSEEPRNSPHTVSGKGIHTSDPKGKPSYQPRGQRKDDETAAYVPRGRAAGRKTYCDSSEPRRSAYVFYRTVNVNQEPKFSGSTAVPEPYGRKCSKPKNQLDTNRRFSTQTENYDKYTSGSYNAPTWRRRNPHAKTFPKFGTTIQSQKDTEVNRKQELYPERRIG
ncbi:uncharacterized protein C12orf50 homolog [Caloenas nicobarica]|uniref:uncharacterized protein C12orf50 homolog n=1 Tax=Caloenas nicobarica TaxID=187106 RepID=UPI0032B83283